MPILRVMRVHRTERRVRGIDWVAVLLVLLFAGCKRPRGDPPPASPDAGTDGGTTAESIDEQKARQEFGLTPDGKALFFGSPQDSAAVLRTAMAERPPTDRERRLALVYWAFIVDAYTTGELSPVFAVSGLHREVAQMARNWPSIFVDPDEFLATRSQPLIDPRNPQFSCEEDCAIPATAIVDVLSGILARVLVRGGRAAAAAVDVEQLFSVAENPINALPGGEELVTVTDFINDLQAVEELYAGDQATPENFPDLAIAASELIGSTADLAELGGFEKGVLGAVLAAFVSGLEVGQLANLRLDCQRFKSEKCEPQTCGDDQECTPDRCYLCRGTFLCGSSQGNECCGKGEGCPFPLQCVSCPDGITRCLSGEDRCPCLDTQKEIECDGVRVCEAFDSDLECCASTGFIVPRDQCADFECDPPCSDGKRCQRCDGGEAYACVETGERCCPDGTICSGLETCFECGGIHSCVEPGAPVVCCDGVAEIGNKCSDPDLGCDDIACPSGTECVQCGDEQPSCEAPELVRCCADDRLAVGGDVDCCGDKLCTNGRSCFSCSGETECLPRGISKCCVEDTPVECFFRNYAGALCEKMFDCCPSKLPPGVVNQAACQEASFDGFANFRVLGASTIEDIVANVDAGNLVFDFDKADQCVNRIRELSCGYQTVVGLEEGTGFSPLVEVAGCEPFLTSPSGDVGGLPCATSYTCGTGYVCMNINIVPDFACVPYPPTGTQCETFIDLCFPGESCDPDGVCAPKRNAGDDCSRNLHCTSDTCLPCEPDPMTCPLGGKCVGTYECLQ